MSGKQNTNKAIISTIALVLLGLATGLITAKALIMLAVIIAFVALFAYIWGNIFDSKSSRTMQQLEDF